MYSWEKAVAEAMKSTVREECNPLDGRVKSGARQWCVSCWSSLALIPRISEQILLPAPDSIATSKSKSNFDFNSSASFDVDLDNIREDKILAVLPQPLLVYCSSSPLFAMEVL